MDAEKKYTATELQAILARKEGKQVTGTVSDAGSGKVYSLQELAEEQDISVPELGEQQAAPDNEPEKVRRDPVSVSPEDLELAARLKDVAFGPDPKDESDQESMVDTGSGLCPNCSWDLSKDKEYHATDEDKIEYVRSVLGGRRFVKQVSFMGGAVQVRYRSMRVAEEKAVVEAISNATANGNVFGESNWTLLFRKYQLLCMLQELRLSDRIIVYPEVLPTPQVYSEFQGDNYLEDVYNHVTVNWDTSLHALLLRGCIATTEILAELSGKVDDPDFWEGPLSR